MARTLGTRQSVPHVSAARLTALVPAPAWVTSASQTLVLHLAAFHRTGATTDMGEV